MWDWAGRASFLCWLAGHPEALWKCGAKGMEWRCQECGRTCPSVLKHLKPGQLA